MILRVKSFDPCFTYDCTSIMGHDKGTFIPVGGGNPDFLVIGHNLRVNLARTNLSRRDMTCNIYQF